MNVFLFLAAHWPVIACLMAPLALLPFRGLLARLFFSADLGMNLKHAGVFLVMLTMFLVGLIIDNPNADKHDAKNANEQRRTIAQIAGGLLAFGALLFGALRAHQTEKQLEQGGSQLEQARRQLLSQENLKFRELLQARWHNALDLLGQLNGDNKPQIESRVAAILMLHSVCAELDPEQLELVRETVYRYISLNAKLPTPATKPSEGGEDHESDANNSTETGERSLRQDIDCCCTLIRRFAHHQPIAVDMRGVSLDDADLQGARLEHWRLDGTHLRGANLQGAHLENAILNKIDLSGADLRGAKLDRAILDRADLSAASMDAHTSFVGAQLTNCIMNSTHASGADFQDSNWVGAHVNTGTDLSNCKFKGADVTGVNFSQASGIKDTDLADAKGYEPPTPPPPTSESAPEDFSATEFMDPES